MLSGCAGAAWPPGVTVAANRLAALTGKLAGLPSPRDELAIIIARRVVAHPVVVAAMHGQVQISGFASRAAAGQLLQFLLSR